MRSRVAAATIERQGSALDELTGTGGEWESFAEVYADIRPLSARELFNAQQVQSLANYRIETEYIAGVTSEMRVKWGERLFEIESAINVNEANRSLEMLCVEKV